MFDDLEEDEVPSCPTINRGRPLAELHWGKTLTKERAASAHAKGTSQGKSGSYSLGLGKGNGRGGERRTAGGSGRRPGGCLAGTRPPLRMVSIKSWPRAS